MVGTSYGSNLLYHVNLQVHSIHRTLAVINLTPKSISEVKVLEKLSNEKFSLKTFSVTKKKYLEIKFPKLFKYMFSVIISEY